MKHTSCAAFGLAVKPPAESAAAGSGPCYAKAQTVGTFLHHDGGIEHNDHRNLKRPINIRPDSPIPAGKQTRNQTLGSPPDSQSRRWMTDEREQYCAGPIPCPCINWVSANGR
jgi:hypothetical protein